MLFHSLKSVEIGSVVQTMIRFAYCFTYCFSEFGENEGLWLVGACSGICQLGPSRYLRGSNLDLYSFGSFFGPLVLSLERHLRLSVGVKCLLVSSVTLPCGALSRMQGPGAPPSVGLPPPPSLVSSMFTLVLSPVSWLVTCPPVLGGVALCLFGEISTFHTARNPGLPPPLGRHCLCLTHRCV